MYTLYKLVRWLIQSKKAELNNYLVAHITKEMIPEGEERDKAVGNALLKAEQETQKRAHLWNMLKYYANHRNDGSWAKGEVAGEEPKGTEETV